MSTTVPMSAAAIVARLAAVLAARTPGHPLRVAIDGPPWSMLDIETPLAMTLTERGRPTDVVDVAGFLRPASVRLEHGRDDPDAFFESWIDVDALRREVLMPLGHGGSRRWLPSLWDASADRATRAGYELAAEHSILIVRGWFLLGVGLPFDVTVHLALSDAARRRRVPATEAARELPAYRRYDAEARPIDEADFVIRCDDPAHPAVIDRLTTATDEDGH